MGFRALWPLAFLVLVPVIILFYILRQQAKKQIFSSVLLWREALKSNTATKPWEKLKRNLLMALQIAAVILLTMALMGPWLRSSMAVHGQAVVVIDNSASMGTLYEGTRTRLEAAKAAAAEYVEALPAGTSIHVISSDKQAVLVLSNSTDRVEAKRRIDAIEQTQLPGDLSLALGLVRSCAGQSEECEIAFFTDTAFDQGDLGASVESFYSGVENFTMENVSAVWRGDTLEVLALVTDNSDKGSGGAVEVNLYGVDREGQERLLDIAQARVEADENAPVYFELAAAQLYKVTALRAEINGEDALSADNSAGCTLEDEGERQVLLLSKSNIFVEKALRNLSGVKLSRTEESEVAGGDTGYDLYIFDGIVPKELPEQGNLLFIGCGEEELAPEEGEVNNQLLTLAGGEVTSYVAGSTIGTNQSKIYRLPPWGTSFLLSTEGKCAGFFGVGGGRRVAALGFDLHETDFGLCAEFPILMSNLCDFLLETGLTDRSSYTAGESVLLHGDGRGGDVTMTAPDGSMRSFSAEESVGAYYETAEPGIYSISQEMGDKRNDQQFAVAFPTERESRVESAQSMQGIDGEAKTPAASGTRELARPLLLFLLLLLVAEWFLYLRQQ